MLDINLRSTVVTYISNEGEVQGSIPGKERFVCYQGINLTLADVLNRCGWYLASDVSYLGHGVCTAYFLY